MSARLVLLSVTKKEARVSACAPREVLYLERWLAEAGTKQRHFLTAIIVGDELVVCVAPKSVTVEGVRAFLPRGCRINTLSEVYGMLK